MLSTGTDDLVSASAEAEAALRKRLEAMLALSREALGDGLLAAVLGGSLARGQGMVLETERGPVLLSDVDLYLVREVSASAADAPLRERLLAETRDDPFFRAPLDLALVEPGYFRNMGRVLPAYQLAHGARLLYATDEERARTWLRGLPERGPVDREDATRLLWNRLAEEMWMHGRDRRDEFDAVHRMKILIDAPLAWLAATGRYSPFRREQRESLERITRDWTGVAGEWAEWGCERMHAWIESVRTRPLTPESLRDRAGLDENDRPPLPEADPLRRWVWPFVRALLQPTPTAMEADLGLRVAVEEGAAGAEDQVRMARWLRRHRLPARLRQARRWAPLAPVAIRPWWQHAVGGSGEERVYAACILRWAGLEGWSAPLAGLLHEPLAQGQDDETISARLGRCWADWILGGGRR